MERAARIRRRPSGVALRFQSEAGALERKGRWDGKGETIASDHDGQGNEAASAVAASGKGGARVEETIA